MPKTSKTLCLFHARYLGSHPNRSNNGCGILVILFFFVSVPLSVLFTFFLGFSIVNSSATTIEVPSTGMVQFLSSILGSVPYSWTMILLPGISLLSG
jgi:hypothetical protein